MSMACSPSSASSHWRRKGRGEGGGERPGWEGTGSVPPPPHLVAEGGKVSRHHLAALCVVVHQQHVQTQARQRRRRGRRRGRRGLGGGLDLPLAQALALALALPLALPLPLALAR